MSENTLISPGIQDLHRSPAGSSEADRPLPFVPPHMLGADAERDAAREREAQRIREASSLATETLSLAMDAAVERLRADLPDAARPTVDAIAPLVRRLGPDVLTGFLRDLDGGREVKAMKALIREMGLRELIVQQASLTEQVRLMNDESELVRDVWRTIISRAAVAVIRIVLAA